MLTVIIRARLAALHALRQIIAINCLICPHVNRIAQDARERHIVPCLALRAVDPPGSQVFCKAAQRGLRLCIFLKDPADGLRVFIGDQGGNAAPVHLRLRERIPVWRRAARPCAEGGAVMVVIAHALGGRFALKLRKRHDDAQHGASHR